MMEYKEGGLNDQGGSVDPVSGNEVPPGALKEEVRDDIDARLSEGEFVFPADVVRYIGLEKLMMMRQQAKAGLARMEDMGQMSNADEAVMEDTVPASVFDMPDDMDVPAIVIAELEMAEGGDVKGDKRYKSFRELMGTDGDKAEIVTYVNDAGRKIIIMHINGAPVSQVPEGFYPEGSDPADPVVPDPPTAPTTPPVIKPKYQEDDDPGPDTPNATIVTGGYISNGRIIGGTTWGVSYEFDGRVNLKNPEYGEIQLTAEEAKSLDIGGKGIGGFLASLTPEGVKKDKAATAALNSGSPDNPGAGNEIHKALVERADLQKKGREFVEGRSPELGLGDSIKSLFGQGPRNELEGAIAQALGKTSNTFTAADYAIVGLALKGGAQVGDLGTGGPDYSKVTKVQELLKAIDNNLIRSGLDRPDAIGLGTSARDPDTSPEVPDDPGGIVPPVFTSQDNNPNAPGEDTVPPSPAVDPRLTQDDDPGENAGLDGGFVYTGSTTTPPPDQSDTGPVNSYSIPSSPAMFTPTNFERTSTPFNAGGLGAKKRKGLASRK